MTLLVAACGGYYHRATTTSRPMSTLIGVVMAVLLGALAVLAGVPMLLALTRTVPNAVRLGWRSDTAAGQTRLARAIFRDHVLCFALMLAFLVLLLLTS